MGPAHQLSGLGGPWDPGPLSLFPVPRALGAGAGGSHVPDPSASRLAFRDSLSTGFSGDKYLLINPKGMLRSLSALIIHNSNSVSFTYQQP